MIMPTKKYLLIALDPAPKETASGIQLAYVTEKPKYKETHGTPTLYGEVIATGNDVQTVTKGNRVAFGRADAWRFEKETKALVHEDAVLAIV